MSARCTGACCDVIVLNRPGTYERLDLRELVAKKDREQSEHSARLLALLRPIAGTEQTQFSCSALTETGCALRREDRPWMCEAFPYGYGWGCSHCGAYSDAEARGVALAVRG